MAAATATELEAESEASPWRHSSQLGVALSGGNSDSQTYSAKQATSYVWAKNTIRSTGHYLVGINAGTMAANNWHLDFRYERSLSERLSLYAGPGVEGDPFAGFESRWSGGLGARYWLIVGDKKRRYLSTELGYQYQNQNNVAGTALASVTSHFIRIFAEGATAFTKSVTGKISVELLPDLADTRNLLVNFEPVLSVELTEVLSLQLSLRGRYDGLPVAGKEKFDWQYLTALVADY